MSFDGIVTKSVVRELRENLVGGRVDKIYQQEKDEILLNIHNKSINYKLVLSASSNNPRIYITNYSKKNPQAPPMFCMLLRKHLSGGIVLNIEQYELDRVVFIDISSLDELGLPTEKRLIIEIMGKHSNIILIEKSTQKIIDSIKRVPEDISRVRQILPGFIYESPPAKDKINPLSSTKEEFLNLMEKTDKNLPVFKFFYFNYLGFSPLISREICFNANLDIYRTIGSLSKDDIEELFDSFNELVTKVIKEDFTPLFITSENTNDIDAFYSLDINQYGSGNKTFVSSISQVLDTYYRKKDILDRISQKSQSIRKSIQVKLDRALSKLGKQKMNYLKVRIEKNIKYMLT